MLLNTAFHDKLQRGEPTLGTHFLFSDPDIPELIGDTGQFDYAEFSAEYSTFDMNLLYHLARSAQCGNLPLMIKLDQESQGFWAQAAIGAGFQSVLFTDIRSPADVDLCHRCIRPDNPSSQGHMGVKLRRMALSGYESQDYLARLESIVLGIMLEKQLAIDNLDSILRRAQERGIAFIQWGPADFAFSAGWQRSSAGEELRDIEKRVIQSALSHGVAPRVEIAAVSQAADYIALGVRHFCIGWDRLLYRQALQELGQGMRKTQPFLGTTGNSHRP
ncbi:MAG: aldolase/citrate lyase family protein [bacterium]|nr:aldolase/citrate lyase family protein [bacterium]